MEIVYTKYGVFHLVRGAHLTKIPGETGMPGGKIEKQETGQNFQNSEFPYTNRGGCSIMDM